MWPSLGDKWLSQMNSLSALVRLPLLLALLCLTPCLWFLCSVLHTHRSFQREWFFQSPSNPLCFLGLVQLCICIKTLLHRLLLGSSWLTPPILPMLGLAIGRMAPYLIIPIHSLKVAGLLVFCPSFYPFLSLLFWLPLLGVSPLHISYQYWCFYCPSLLFHLCALLSSRNFSISQDDQSSLGVEVLSGVSPEFAAYL